MARRLWFANAAFAVSLTVNLAYGSVALAGSADRQGTAEQPSNVAPLDLLQYVKNHPDTVGREQIQAQQPYNRLKHFGSWVDADEDCQDTRTEVLIRDHQRESEITFKNGETCRVAKSAWRDPYTDKEFTTATSIQIDHVVPLKNAYLSGAYEWPAAKRCEYANFLENDFHLRAVSGSENMRKGDRGPEAYLPPNRDFQCEYLREWVMIKVIWQLTFAEQEAQAIANDFIELNCEQDLRFANRSFIDQQRKMTDVYSSACQDF